MNLRVKRGERFIIKPLAFILIALFRLFFRKPLSKIRNNQNKKNNNPKILLNEPRKCKIFGSLCVNYNFFAFKLRKIAKKLVDIKSRRDLWRSKARIEYVRGESLTRKIKDYFIKPIIYVGLLLISINFVLGIPNTITLQGKLTDSSGSPLKGLYNMSFRIYDAYTGGNILWQLEDKNVSTDTNGIYDIVFQNVNLNFSDEYYLGIIVKEDTESTPRVNLTSSPYSFRANISEDLNPLNKYTVSILNVTQNLSVGNNILWIDSTNNLVGIGTLSPNFKLDVVGQINASALNVTGNIRVSQLTSCTAIETDADGNFVCGVDDGGSVSQSGGWINTSTITKTDLHVNITTGNLTVIGGRIAIGKRYPLYKLDVNGTINASALNITGNIRVSQLTSCDTIDTDADGNFKCGSDDAGGAYAAAWKRANTTDYLGGTAANASLLRVGNITDILKDAYKKANFTSNLNNINDSISLWNRSSSNIFLREITGNIGIGTTSPNQKLVVVGTANVTAGLNVTGGLRISELASCDTIDTDAAGNFKCGSDDSGAAEASGWKRANTTDYLGGTAANASLLRVGNITDILKDAWKVGNLTARIPTCSGTDKLTSSDGTTFSCASDQDSDTTYSAGSGISEASEVFTVAGNTCLDQDADGLGVTADCIDGAELKDSIDLDNDMNIESNTLFIGYDGGSYNGLVGVGTATPAETLAVSGNASVTKNMTVSSAFIFDYNSTCAGFRFGSTGGLILSCE